MPDPIRVCFLGTGGTVPFNLRRMPCIAIKYKSNLILFDVGEGCQYSILSLKLRPIRSNLWILLSHLHADHTAGLPGLLTTLKMGMKRNSVNIFGPIGTKQFVKLISEAFLLDELPYELKVREIECGDNKPLIKVVDKHDFQIFSFRTEHDIPSVGYIFQEKSKPKFNVKKANEMGIPPTGIRKLLVEGKPIKLKGKIIKPDDVLDYNVKSRKIIYTGDTRPIKDPNILDAFDQADLLIHDATFIGIYHYKLAEERYHSTIAVSYTHLTLPTTERV